MGISCVWYVYMTVCIIACVDAKIDLGLLSKSVMADEVQIGLSLYGKVSTLTHAVTPKNCLAGPICSGFSYLGI